MPDDYYNRIRLFLVACRFPFYENHICQGALLCASNRDAEGGTERAKVVAYHQELQGKSHEELDRLAAEARAITRQLAMYERELDHLLPDLASDYRTADFSWWALHRYWTTDEAAALALGADPRRCDRNRLLPLAGNVPFAAKYLDFCDLIEREQSFRAPDDKISPAEFVTWADGRIDLPQRLIDAVKGAPPNQPSSRARIEELEKQVEWEKSSGRVFHPKERTSLARLVLGVATTKYGHNPEMARNSTARRVSPIASLQGTRLRRIPYVSSWMSLENLPDGAETREHAPTPICLFGPEIGQDREFRRHSSPERRALWPTTFLAKGLFV